MGEKRRLGKWKSKTITCGVGHKDKIKMELSFFGLFFFLDPIRDTEETHSAITVAFSGATPHPFFSFARENVNEQRLMIVGG